MKSVRSIHAASHGSPFGGAKGFSNSQTLQAQKRLGL